MHRRSFLKHTLRGQEPRERRETRDHTISMTMCCFGAETLDEKRSRGAAAADGVVVAAAKEVAEIESVCSTACCSCSAADENTRNNGSSSSSINSVVLLQQECGGDCSVVDEGSRGSGSGSGNSKTNKKTKKRVRWGGPNGPVHVVGTVPSLRDMTAEEVSDSYWVPDDMQNIKRSTLLTVKDIARHHKRDLQKFETICGLVQTLTSADEVDDVLFDPSVYARLMKNCWSNVTAHEGNGRGVEKYVSSSYRKERTDRIKKMRRAVLKLQSRGASDEDVARAYRKHTVASSILARIGGAADAMSVDQPYVNVACAGGTSMAKQQQRRRQDEDESDDVEDCRLDEMPVVATTTTAKVVKERKTSKASSFSTGKPSTATTTTTTTTTVAVTLDVIPSPPPPPPQIDRRSAMTKNYGGNTNNNINNSKSASSSSSPSLLVRQMSQKALEISISPNDFLF